ncbi:hypothetical protein ES708_33047 [subsurface metagenome]
MPQDDEQFAHVAILGSGMAAGVAGGKQSEHAYFDFSGQNLVTTRDLAFIAAASACTGRAVGKVYYERFKPTAIELSQLIATRR